jgi:hypothetical protein
MWLDTNQGSVEIPTSSTIVKIRRPGKYSFNASNRVGTVIRDFTIPYPADAKPCGGNEIEAN